MKYRLHTTLHGPAQCTGSLWRHHLGRPCLPLELPETIKFRLMNIFIYMNIEKRKGIPNCLLECSPSVSFYSCPGHGTERACCKIMVLRVEMFICSPAQTFISMLIFLKLPRPWVGVVDYAWDVDSMLRWEVPCHHTDIPDYDDGDEMMLVKMQNDVLVVDGCGRPQGVDGCWLLYLDILDRDGEEKATSILLSCKWCLMMRRLQG